MLQLNSYHQSIIDEISGLQERISTKSYLDTAKEIRDSYKVRSKIKIKSGRDKADYDWVADIINLRPVYKSLEEFIKTVLHEIRHAKDRQKMGAKKYEKKYQQAGVVAVHQGKDFHDDNKFEEDAERWARKEYSRKWSQKFR
jgi:hypothetical protein|tara:strand:+ start:68 stop:493 length:426 start_codon:yes stop_codon:yes gene_type:complete